MQVIRHNDPQSLYKATHHFLMENELLNNVMIGLLSRMIHQNETFGDLFLAHVTNKSGKVIAATMLAKRGVILSRVSDKDAIPLLVQAYVDEFDTLIDVVGDPEDSSHFAELWHQEQDIPYKITMEYGNYQLDEVTLPKGVSGYSRFANNDDFDLLVDWLIQFNHDTKQNLNYSREDAIANISRKLETPILGGIRLWIDDGNPVSMAAATRELPNGGNISLVYTPKQYRGNGYASAITAHVSQQILDMEKLFCCLATDMANPISNKIYRAIGYYHIGNHRRIKFE